MSVAATPTAARAGFGGRAPGPHEANLFDIDARRADVISVQDGFGHLDVRIGEAAA